MLTENRKSVSGFLTRSGCIAVAGAAIAGGLISSARAADGTWQTGGDLNWPSASNWVGGVVPGVADATFVNADTATFTGTGTAGGATVDTYIVAIDANRNIKNLKFDNINTINFTLGTASGQAIHLTGGGTTEVTANLTNASAAGAPNLAYAIDAPIAIHGNSYTFLGNAPQGLPGGGGANTNRQGGLQPRGQITFSGSGPSTIYLDGTHNDGHQAQNQIKYALADTVANPIGIIKNGTGTWELSANAGGIASYHGDTVVNDGWVRLNGTADGLHKGASANSTYILNGGGIRVSIASTVKGVVFNTPTSTSLAATARPLENSGGAVLSILRNSGPGLLLNYTALPQHAGFSNPISFTGSVAEQGGIEFNNGGNLYGGVAIGLTTTAFDLGSVLRPVDVDRGAEANEFDLRIAGIVSGTGGMVKIGAGRLRLDSAANPLTGTLEVREGQLLFNSSNAMTGNPALLVSGGDLRIKGAQTQTFGSVTLTNGLVSASDSASTISAPTITLNPAVSGSATINAIINDNGGATTVTKNGAGPALLGGANTYTGGTIINAGSLTVDGDANDTIIGGPNVTTVGGADLRGGKLIFDYTGGSSPATQIVSSSNGLAFAYSTNFASGDIKSTTATSSRGLGYADDTAASKFTVMYTLYGDANLTGVVNFDDLLLVAQNYSATSTGKTWGEGDFTYDGSVNFDDLLKLAQNYGGSVVMAGDLANNVGGAFANDWTMAMSLVPEPASLGLLGGLVAIARRRR